MFGMLTPAQQAAGPTFVYPTYDDLFADLSSRMQVDGYKVVKARSHRGKIGGSDVPGNEMVRCDLVCDRGGRPYKCLATKHKTTTKKTDCPWKAKAVNRKMMGGWVLTIICDQHNHEPGTPEPVGLEVGERDAEGETEGNDAGAVAAGAPPDAETAAAIAVAGVSQAVLRLTGETFQSFKGEYRKMPKPQRLQVLANLQMRIAAIYAVENEDMQRQLRMDQQQKRHRQIEETRRHSGSSGAAGDKRARRESGGAGEGQQQESPSRRRGNVQSDVTGLVPESGEQDGRGLHMEPEHQLDPQLMNPQQPHGQADVDPFLHAQFQVSVPQTGPGTPPIGQFHPHFSGQSRRLRGRSQVQP